MNQVGYASRLGQTVACVVLAFAPVCGWLSGDARAESLRNIIVCIGDGMGDERFYRLVPVP